MQENDPERQNDCGQVGINGGYFDDPNLRFGVNCYGVKRKPTEKDLEILNYQPTPGLSQEEI